MEGRETGPFLWTLWGDRIVHVTVEENDAKQHVEARNGAGEPSFTELGLGFGVTVSPDGRWVLVSLGEPPTSDIMLVEGFR